MGYNEDIFFKIYNEQSNEWIVVDAVHNSWSYSNIYNHYMSSRMYLKYLDIEFINYELNSSKKLLYSEEEELLNVQKKLKDIMAVYNVKENQARAYYEYIS